MGIFGGAPANGNQMKSCDIHATGLNRREIISQTKVPPLGLPWKTEPRSFGLLVFLIDDQVIALRLAREITINNLWYQQPFRFRALFQLRILWQNGLSQQRLVLLRAALSLLELPLTFK